MVPLKKFREAVFYALFAFDISSEENQNELLFMQELSMTKNNIRRAFLRVNLIKEKLDIIDPIIQQYVHDYDFERISKVEKNMLRLALYEIFFDKDVPLPVAISEAVRITKKFSSLEGSKFVHAVLDSASNHPLQLSQV